MTQNEQAQLHLTILGERKLYHVTAKHHSTKQIKNEFLKPEEVIPILTNWNNNGFTTWISINDKENDGITGVTALQDFWIDIDARPKGVDERLATHEEMQEAIERTIKLKNYIENQYSAYGFTANSGNGFHIHFPLPRFELPIELREQVNHKVRIFAKTTAKFVNVKIDNTYDISRRSTLIGTQNNKLPQTPLPTMWDKEILTNGLPDAINQVNKARLQNQTLLETIIKIEEYKPSEQTYLASIKTNHIDIEQLCQVNPKVQDLYKIANKENEEYKKYGYKSRSEAEAGLITILAMEGYSDQEITGLMQNCSLGKWQEKTDAYHILTLAHSRQIAGKYIKERETQNQLIKDIASSVNGQIVTQNQNEKVNITDINPVLIAKKIIENYNFVLDDDTKLLWYYDKTQGIYNEQSEELIKREIVRLLDTHAKARFYVDVDFWIHYSAPKVKMNKHPELLGVENGVLNLLTKELSPTESSEKLYVTTKIPVKYNPALTCPKIIKFLNLILPENSRLLSQEYIGYCLWGNHQIRKAYIANGPTGTGKTVHQNLNTALLGEQNISNQSIQNLNHNRFAPAELFNKMGNFCDDMPASIVKVTGNFKMATGNGRMAAERKGKDPFYFRNRAKLWLNCNDLAPIQKSEDCDAYYERLLIIDYKIQVKTITQENPQLILELTTPEELSGYLNYALEGLQRLMTNKRFSETMTKEDIRATYVKRTDSSKYFVENYIEVTDEDKDFIFTDDLFQTAVKICHQQKIRPMNKGELTTAIQQFCPGAHPTQIRAGPKETPKRAWRFVKVKVQEVVKVQTQLVSSGNVADVAKEAPPPISSGKIGILKESSIFEKGIIVNELRPPATNATSATFLADLRVCGYCFNFGKGSCEYPSGPGVVKEDFSWACLCCGFQDKNFLPDFEGKGELGV